MKQIKNQRDLFEIIEQQQKQLAEQSKQIRTLKQALLRLNESVRKVSVLAERSYHTATRAQTTGRVLVTEVERLRRRSVE